MIAPAPSGVRSSSRWWSTVGALVLYAAALAATTVRLTSQTDGHLIYALDDAYIHMAMARNMAQFGTWGVHVGSFAAASSSPLWTLILSAGFATTGIHEWLPLLLNILFSVIVIVRLADRLRRAQLPVEWQCIVLVGTLLFTPLAALTWLGMEHTLFVLFTLETAWTTADATVGRPHTRPVMLSTLVVLLVATRYEGLFIVMGCAVALVVARRLRELAVLTASASVPVLAVGAWQVSHGWYFLPASILMKQTVLATSGHVLALDGVVRNIVAGDIPLLMIALLVAAVWCLVDCRRDTRDPGATTLLTIFLTATTLHIALARFGYLYRYESYLVALGVSAVGSSLAAAAVRSGSRRETPVMTAMIFVLVVLIFGSRTIASLGQTAVTAGHIYRQQRQMAAFLSRYYDQETVALNDIGAAAFFANTRIDDLMGLSSLAAAEARRAGHFDAAWINEWLTRDDVPLAIVYDAWFPPPIDFQSRWVRVARWQTDQGDAVEGHVSFYARDRASAARLTEHLREFATSLPRGTTQTLE